VESQTQAGAETLAQRYARQLALDQPLMQKYQPGPQSGAYCALDLENSRALTSNEKKHVDAKF
jgi:hypothetical protein